VLAGEQTLDEIVLNRCQWYERTASRCTGQEGGRGRPRRRVVQRRGRHRGRVRPAADGHRLQPLHPAGAGQGPGRRDRLPRHRRHQHDDRGGGQVPARGRHRRRPARAGGGQRADAAAACRSRSCTSCRG
jgi:hypothetical protein